MAAEQQAPQTEAGRHFLDVMLPRYGNMKQSVGRRTREEFTNAILAIEQEAARPLPEPSLNVERLAALMRDHCHDSADEGVPILLRHKHLAPFVRDDCAVAILKALSHPPDPATAHEVK